jgi:hypothetical protein
MNRFAAAEICCLALWTASGLACVPRATVPYPFDANTRSDSTPPSLTLSTSDLVGAVPAQATNAVAGQPATSIQGGLLDMSHTSLTGTPNPATDADGKPLPPIPEPDQRSLIVRGTVRDAESGVRSLRVRGIYRTCEADGTLVDYQGDHTYYETDLTIGGATTIPVGVGFDITVPIYPLLHPLRDPSDPGAGRKDGQNGSFEFQLEAYNGASQIAARTRTIVYWVGTVACP